MKCCLATMMLLLVLFVQTQAYEICLDPENNTPLYCYNTYNTIGYCCNFFNGYYHSCCSYLQVWALWYFWFGIVMFLLCCAVVVGCCKRCMDQKNGRNKSTSSLDVTMGQVTGTNVVMPVTQPMPQPVMVPDVPPTYQQVETQGINAQYKEFAGYGGTPVIVSATIDTPPSSPHTPK